MYMYYHRTNLPPSLTPIAYFAIPTERSLCTHATNLNVNKSRSQAVNCYVHVRAERTCTLYIHCVYSRSIIMTYM